MNLYGINYSSPRKGDAEKGILIKTLPSETFTLTALLAPVSMTGYPTFGDDDLHTLSQSDTFRVDENMIPEDIRCSCLTGGRFCLSGAHWLLEYDVNSEYWLDEHGQSKTGALARYTGDKSGNRNVIGDGKQICCIEGFVEPVPERMVPPTPSMFTLTASIFTS
ncbi:hypothetical protein E8E11_000871 [Didymella keratinophila]|nr:hypothetical protein E8E11_000871 [Didymella keratinophila]